jgi:hypothetical protein
MPLSADELLELDDLRPPTVLHVKAWGRDVYLLDPTADVRDEWEIFCTANQGKKASWRAKLASLLLCDESGKRLFPHDADVAKLGKKGARALHEIWMAGQKLLMITDEEIEELEKK